MRGKARRPGLFDVVCRITPAYAGKRGAMGTPSKLHQDHPRVCGEKPIQPASHLSRRGSPPRMRGKGALPHGTFCHIGITPAYAGKRNRGRSFWKILGDHPRVCGEKTNLIHRLPRGQGSPPRMRGKVLCFLRFFAQYGITPAYAGKSAPFQKLTTQSWDHPRVCGEKRDGVAEELAQYGITPAYAGKRAPKAKR